MASWEADIDTCLQTRRRSSGITRCTYNGVNQAELCQAQPLLLLLIEKCVESGKTYFLRVKRNSDNSVEDIELQYNALVSDVVTFVTATTAFAKYDIYSFGEENYVTKLMRITSVSTGGNDLRRKITASNTWMRCMTMTEPLTMYRIKIGV